MPVYIVNFVVNYFDYNYPVNLVVNYSDAVHDEVHEMVDQSQ